ncbi:MAG: ABC transporter permease subunit [Chloroflexi bacterium]|nr:ABC transporter permease subunit [Chloroflexota bacterium]
MAAGKPDFSQDNVPPARGAALLTGALWKVALRLVALGFIDAFAIWFVSGLISEQDYILAGFVAVITLGINAVFLIDGLYPYRWFSPGLTLLILMLIYPTIFTIYVAFTNYRDGNLLTRSQAEDVLLKRTFLPDDSVTYSWTAFRSTDNPDEYALWLIPDSDRGGEVMFAERGEIVLASEVDLGEGTLDEDGIPTALQGYERVPKNQLFAILDSVLSKIEFGEADNVIMLNPQNPTRQAGVFRVQFTLNDDGSLVDNQTGVRYEAKQGTYSPVDGPDEMKNAEGVLVDADGVPLEVIRPGYYVVTGLDNIKDLVTDDKIRGPFLRVFVWTFAHAFFSVFLTFWFGLFLAIVMNAKFFPGRAIFRTMLLVPYAMPAFISVLVWRGLLNEHLGVINKAIESILGVENGPRWFSDPTWVKVGILLIQLWLGFPYMMLITTGALQSIPGDIYEAARVDGANPYQQFRYLTLPLLLVTVGPLLIASFAYNFNNFTIVELFAQGGPPISPDTAAGHSDILITYTYALAFGSGRGANYGFASTISIVIFLIVATVTFFNFRFTRTWEEISENV